MPDDATEEVKEEALPARTSLLLPYEGKRGRPRFHVEDLLREFASYNRGPFVEILAELMQCVPEPKQLQEFANKHPDRWANAIGTISRLSGYHDKLEIKGNIFLEVHSMGDAELMKSIEEVNKQIKKMGAPSTKDAQDAEFEEVVDVSVVVGEKAS